jgi:hypothetical protein
MSPAIAVNDDLHVLPRFQSAGFPRQFPSLIVNRIEWAVKARVRRAMSKKKLPQKLIPWLEAKKRHRLSDMHIQMARELGMNPKKLGKLDNHKQEPWKLPLPRFIEKCYLKSFKRPRPEKIVPLGKIPSPTASNPAKPAMADRREVKATSEPRAPGTECLREGEDSSRARD